MGRWILFFALVVCVPVTTAEDAGGQLDERLELKVRPRMAPSPGAFRATVLVERDEANRALTVTAESVDYYRSSSISLDGAQSARLHTMVFEQLPAGKYEIVALLERNDGPDVEEKVRVTVSK